MPRYKNQDSQNPLVEDSGMMEPAYYLRIMINQNLYFEQICDGQKLDGRDELRIEL